MGGENWKATDVLGGHANSPRRGNKGLKHGNRGEGTGARDAWMILLGLLKIFTMLVFWGHNEDSTREKFILVTPGTVLSTQHSLYSPNYVLYNSLDHTHTHTIVYGRITLRVFNLICPWKLSIPWFGPWLSGELQGTPATRGCCRAVWHGPGFSRLTIQSPEFQSSL